MVAYERDDRLCMADILAHPWMQGEVATPEEAKEEMVKRHDIIKQRDAKKE